VGSVRSCPAPRRKLNKLSNLGHLFSSPASVSAKALTSAVSPAPMHITRRSHTSRGAGGGCAQDDLKGTGGAGLYYCFAAN
jgi:hypothetical protein